jgi:putative heme-binding domain-containing protein
VCVVLLRFLVHGNVNAAEPLVRPLLPGFTVKELPLRLSNINNLRFAPDGRLFALGYDGRIHVLRDTDGDGLEDDSELFWDKSTLSVPVGMSLAPEGVYVSSHGKISLLRDTDGDGKADVEVVIASGWPPTDVGSGGVDATGVTRDKNGNLYFGLLVADYSNAYRLRKRKDLKPDERAWLTARGDKGGDTEEQVSLYDLESKRGTIQKWNRATGQIETLATGIRVPYTLAFNRIGDLFVTDQEGETWMPNGNPLDELNHVIAGRNYGFPPRHEKWLPKLVSEPPVVGFGPQHQSACGFFFNDSGPNQKSFGPEAWEGDAFVAGESRGKIWRVRLAKTQAGYVGRPFLFARLSMLTTDVALSPRGDLYVSCHSGPPDWGTGPQGVGKLFKISYTEQIAPQPTAIWVAGQTEVRVAFDRILADSSTNGLVGTEIEFGEYVRAGDRFEVLKPPYQVVKVQESTPRGRLRVLSANLLSETTIQLFTEPHRQPGYYTLTLPNILPRNDQRAKPALMDVAYNLNGVEAIWRPRDTKDKRLWSSWLPHFDSDVIHTFFAGSSDYREFYDLSRTPVRGLLTLRSQINLPRGTNLLRFENNGPFEVKLGDQLSKAHKQSRNQFVASAKLASLGERITIIVQLATGSAIRPALHVSYSSDADTTDRSLPLNFFQLPWVPRQAPFPKVELPKLELAGGDYERGRELFFGEQLKCATCHRVRGEGKEIGPDLGNLAHRDAASVLRDLKEPSAMINPDYVAYNLSMSDGQEFNGFVREQTVEGLRLLTIDGKEVVLKRTDLRALRASSVSLMPTGLTDALKEGQLRDLLTFLLNEPPKRTRGEIESILADSIAVPRSNPKGSAANKSATDNPPRTLKVVLVASQQDHGPGQHDYPAWQKTWVELLNRAPGVSASAAWEWPTAEQFNSARVVVFYYWNHNWSSERLEQVDEFLARGGGIVLLHSAIIEDKNPEQLAIRFGLAAQPQRTKYLHTSLDLQIETPHGNPITRGFPRRIHLLDEPYWPMIGNTNDVQVLATTEQEGTQWPMMWSFENGRGRVFARRV